MLATTRSLWRGRRVPRVRVALTALSLLLAFPASGSFAEESETDHSEQIKVMDGMRQRSEELRALHPSDAVRHDVARLGSIEIRREDIPVMAAPTTGGGTQSTTTTWAPYTGTFGHAEAAHLLHRTVIGASFAEIDQAVQDGLTQTVVSLFAPQAFPAQPGPWATEPIPDVTGWTQEMIDELIMQYQIYGELNRLWWTEVMIDAPMSLRENMVHFWHDHFATGQEKVFFPQSMYIQNDLFRQHATGNFKDLVLAASLDPAMILWLDNQLNTSGNINENFARELLELFTLGEGNYEQEDIIQTARAFTGYQTYDAITVNFNEFLHDHGYKTILGQSGYWFPEDVIDIIFDQDACALFICEKLYKWFIDEYPDPVLIAELAQDLRDANYEIEPVLEKMFLSEHFFDAEFRGSAISDGVDHYAGVPRTFGLASQIDLSDYLSNQALLVRYGMQVYSHMLFDPPNVSGWDGYRTWVNSFTLPWRKTLDVAWVDGQVYGVPTDGAQVDAIAWANTLTNPHDAYALVDDTALLLFGLEPTELVRQRMLDELLQGAEPWEWSLFDPGAEAQIQGLIRLAMRLPDMQSK